MTSFSKYKNTIRKIKGKRRKIGITLSLVIIFALLAFITVGSASGAPPKEAWNQTFGGAYSDWANSVQQTSDSGYILAGTTISYGPGEEWDFEYAFDFWLVKTDPDGNEQWNKTFGGAYMDLANSVQQTSDDGYILAGCTNSYGAGGLDFWLVKTDPDGNEQWNKTFGGAGADMDWANSVQQTSDGGYILAGCTGSYGAGHSDFWLVKTDSDGNEQWNQTFGGTHHDWAHSVQQTSDGGYILAGYTGSYGAGEDFWLVKTDPDGNKQWDRTFGGAYSDSESSVQQTSDGGYILVGGMTQYRSTVASDFWLVKTDSDGNEQWNQTFGGPDFDSAYSVQQTADGGYILAGTTGSSPSSFDFWVVKADSNGNEQWNKTFGGTDRDRGNSVQQTSDGGYILAGDTKSYGAGGSDFWLIKVEREPIESKGIPGFEVIFGIAGLLTVIYLFNRKNQR